MIFIQNNPTISLPAGTALAEQLLVAQNPATGVADLCGATDVPIGMSIRQVNVGQQQTVRMLSAGTLEIWTSGTVAKGAPVFTDAGGRVSATQAAGARCVGIAMDATTGVGLISIMPVGALAMLVASVVQGQLTDNSGGTPATTLAAITAGAGYAQADMVAVKNAIAQLALSVNSHRTALVTAGLAV